jgi:hypothetical protein
VELTSLHHKELLDRPQEFLQPEGSHLSAGDQVRVCLLQQANLDEDALARACRYRESCVAAP